MAAPKKPAARTALIVIRVTPAEKAKIEKVARAAKIPVSTYVRDQIVELM